MNEAAWYDLNNPHLSPTQKISVESWFQLPGNVMQYTFWLMAILSIYQPDVSMWTVLLVALVANLVVGVINWFVYYEALVRFLGLSLFHPFVIGVLGLGIAVFLVMHGAYFLAVVSAVTGIFSSMFLELHMILYSFLSRKTGLHPKYYFAKHRLGAQLPF